MRLRSRSTSAFYPRAELAISRAFDHEREERLERVVLRERRLALPERQLKTVVPEHAHPDAACSRDVGGRAGHEQRARWPDAQPLQGEPIRLRAWLVRACGFGRHDRVEVDAYARGCTVPELFGAVRDHADADLLAQPSEDLRCLGPGAELFSHSTNQIRRPRGRHAGEPRPLRDRLDERAVRSGRVREAAALLPPARTDCRTAGDLTPQRLRIQERREEIEKNGVIHRRKEGSTRGTMAAPGLEELILAAEDRRDGVVAEDVHDR